MFAGLGLQATSASYFRLPYKRITADSDTVSSKVFIRVVSTKKAVHVGEPFMVKYMLYNSIQVIDPETNVMVKFNNCYQEEFSVDTTLVVETVNGRRYNVVNLKQYLVIPNDVGPTVLPQIKIQLKLYSKVDTGFFEQEQLVTKDIVSDQNSVMVQKLPLNADSTSFVGAIGKFRIRGSYTQAPKAKNMLIFHLYLDGIGNTKSAAIAVPHFAQGLEVYNINTTRHDSVTNFGIKTRIEYTFQLVANYRGKYDVPPVAFNYYDPEGDEYVKFTSGKYDWQVDYGPQMIVSANTARKQENLLYVDSNLYAATNKTFSYSAWYYILLFIGILLSLYSYFRSYFNEVALYGFGFINTKLNKYFALRSIQKLKAESSTLEEDVFWKRLASILYRYIKGEARIPYQSVSDLSFDTSILAKNVPADIYQQVTSFLNGLQNIRFSAHRSPVVDKVQSCNQLITIVNALDTNWHE